MADRLDNAAGRGAAWALALGADHDRDGDASQAPFRHDLRGISAGYDALSGHVWRVGIAASQASHASASSTALSGTDLGQVAQSAYAGGNFGRISVGGGVMPWLRGGLHWQEYTRDIVRGYAAGLRSSP